MSGAVKLALWPQFGAAVLLSLLAVWILFALGARAQPAETTLGIDADATGNTATSLGQRNPCIQVRKGDTFQVDVTADGVTGLAAWDGYLALNTADQGSQGKGVNVVHIIDRDVQQLLASTPGGTVFDVSESVPEGDGDDGLYHVGGAIIGDRPVGVDGSGVLARLTLQAVDSGVAILSLRPVQTSAGKIGPVLTDVDANHLGDNDGDSFFDGPILDAQVAVDQNCPTSDGAGPVAALGGGGNGVPAWVFAAAALGVVATAGIGGMYFFRLRRAASKNSS